MSHKPCGPITATADLLQYFRAQFIETTGIRLTVATYRRLVARGLEIALYDVPSEYEDADLDRELLTEIQRRYKPIASLTKALWSDNETAILHLDPRRVRKNGRYALHISAMSPVDVPEVTTWLNAAEARITGHIASFYEGHNQGMYGLAADVLGCNPIVASSVPTAILYSPVTQCNLNCIHCISQETRTSKNRLCPTIKERLREWCAQGLVTQIASDYSGDILWADKRFGGELDFLKSLNVPFHIDTNGVCLDDKRAASLLDSRLASLNVSLDAATTETYQRVRRGSPPLEAVIENIRAFMKRRSFQSSAARIPISMSFTLMRSTLHELEPFIRLAGDLGVRTVHGRHLEAYTEDMGTDSLIFDHKRLTKALMEARKVADECGVVLATSDLPGVYAKAGHGRCEVASGSAVILGNGDVAVCCVPKMKIGNLHENSMEEIWNGPRYQEFRRRVNSDTPPDQCASCPMMRSWDNVHSFLPFLTMKDWQRPSDWAL